MKMICTCTMTTLTDIHVCVYTYYVCILDTLAQCLKVSSSNTLMNYLLDYMCTWLRASQIWTLTSNYDITSIMHSGQHRGIHGAIHILGQTLLGQTWCKKDVVDLLSPIQFSLHKHVITVNEMLLQNTLLGWIYSLFNKCKFEQCINRCMCAIHRWLT